MTGRYDRIIATVGIAGVPSAWFNQLADDGFILAPIAHGGMHPITRVTFDHDGRPHGRLITMADFMTASGPLYGNCLTSPAVRSVSLPVPEPGLFEAQGFPIGLDRASMSDLWMDLAAHDPRITCASAGEYHGCALVNEAETAAVFVNERGIWPTDDELETRALVGLVSELVGRWVEAGRPPMTSWYSWLRASGADKPLWTPAMWRCAP